jgi:hypothetical protein
MDYSSLVAARPSVEPFSKSSSQTRRAAIACAMMLLISCAALVATLVNPHHPILGADIDHSLSLRMVPEDGISSRSDFHSTARFTVLQTDPIDSVLKKVKASIEFAQHCSNLIKTCHE